MPHVSIIIPLYLSDLALYRVIDRCMRSLPKADDVEIVIVNDASPIDASDFENYADHWVERLDNGGYTAAVNDGLRAAAGDILIVANDDIVFTPELLARFRAMGDGIFSPKTTDEGAGDKFGSIWGMRRSTFEKLGYLNPEYKHFFSDAEYYDRAKQMNVPITKWHDLIIEHVGGATYQTIDKEALYQEDERNYVNR